MLKRPDSAVSPVQGRSVRFRLLAIALLPMLVILPLLLGVAVVRWNEKFNATLISKVNGDLTIAHQYLARILEYTGEHMQALGHSARFRDVVGSGEQCGPRLAARRQPQGAGPGFSLPHGRRRKDHRVGAPDSLAPSIRSDWPVVASALKGTPSTAIDIFANQRARRHRARPRGDGRGSNSCRPRTRSRPTGTRKPAAWWFIRPARSSLRGRQPAALVGGLLLNQNLVFIDTINDLVYRAASLPEGSQGTATLFLDDVRITTNVRLFEGRRALGTRVSSAVRSTVLDQGKTWLDSAFVVNDWYISAYEPIIDSYGKRVGMLYVGFLEAPFTKAKIHDAC